MEKSKRWWILWNFCALLFRAPALPIYNYTRTLKFKRKIFDHPSTTTICKFIYIGRLQPKFQRRLQDVATCTKAIAAPKTWGVISVISHSAVQENFELSYYKIILTKTNSGYGRQTGDPQQNFYPPKKKKSEKIGRKIFFSFINWFCFLFLNLNSYYSKLCHFKISPILFC